MVRQADIQRRRELRDAVLRTDRRQIAKFLNMRLRDVSGLSRVKLQRLLEEKQRQGLSLPQPRSKVITKVNGQVGKVDPRVFETQKARPVPTFQARQFKKALSQSQKRRIQEEQRAIDKKQFEEGIPEFVSEEKPVFTIGTALRILGKKVKDPTKLNYFKNSAGQVIGVEDPKSQQSFQIKPASEKLVKQKLKENVLEIEFRKEQKEIKEKQKAKAKKEFNYWNDLEKQVAKIEKRSLDSSNRREAVRSTINKGLNRLTGAENKILRKFKFEAIANLKESAQRRYLNKFTSEILTLPYDLTIGLGELGGQLIDKTWFILKRGVDPKTRTLVINELAKAIGESPKEVAKSYDIRTPEGLANLVVTIAFLKFSKGRPVNRVTKYPKAGTKIAKGLKKGSLVTDGKSLRIVTRSGKLSRLSRKLPIKVRKALINRSKKGRIQTATQVLGKKTKVKPSKIKTTTKKVKVKSVSEAVKRKRVAKVRKNRIVEDWKNTGKVREGYKLEFDFKKGKINVIKIKKARVPKTVKAKFRKGEVDAIINKIERAEARRIKKVLRSRKKGRAQKRPRLEKERTKLRQEQKVAQKGRQAKTRISKAKRKQLKSPESLKAKSKELRLARKKGKRFVRGKRLRKKFRKEFKKIVTESDVLNEFIKTGKVKDGFKIDVDITVKGVKYSVKKATKGARPKIVTATEVIKKKGKTQGVKFVDKQGRVQILKTKKVTTKAKSLQKQATKLKSKLQSKQLQKTKTKQKSKLKQIKKVKLISKVQLVSKLRTILGISSVLGQKLATKQKLNQKQKAQVKQALVNATVSKTKTKTILDIIIKSDIAIATKTSLVSAVESAQKIAQKQGQKQKKVQKQKLVQKQVQKQKKTRKVKLPEFNWNSKLPKGTRLKVDGYVKIGNRRVKVVSGLPQNKAWNRVFATGTRKYRGVDKSTPRSFELVAVGITCEPIF